MSNEKLITSAHIERPAPWKGVISSDPVEAAPRGTFRFAFEGLHPDALRAFEIQRERAERFGQVWSARHANALRELQQAYVLTGLGMTAGRTAWPLAVGAGKTESLVAFTIAQYERAQRGHPPLTLLVCMERVEQLSDLYREIVAAGVSPEFVAVHHRKSAKEIADGRLVEPVGLAEAARFPVLLATHAFMLRGESNIAALNRYGDGERSLCVWDESLLKSQGHYLDLTLVDASCRALGSFVGAFNLGTPNVDARDAHAFISARLDLLREVFYRQLAGAPIETIVPPELSVEDETRFRAGIEAALRRRQGGRRDLGGPTQEALLYFLDHVQRPLRVLPFVEQGQRIGVVHYSTLIPESLRRLIVLDASHNIRLLTSKHDADLAVTPVDCAVKSFEDVTVRHLRIGAGKDALERALPRRSSPLVREIVEEIKSWEADEAGVVVTFKQDEYHARRGKPSHVDNLRAAFRAAGIDPDATLADGRRRFVFITWGQHRGVSEFAYCSRVLMVGVSRRTRLDLSAAIVGQRGDLTTPVAADPAEVKQVELSELFHNVVQAIGRGACRVTRNGKALPMRAALICVDEFPAEWWELAMPGVTVQPWKAKHATRARLAADRHEAIRLALASLPPQQDAISTAALRSLARLDGLSRAAYSKALLSAKVDGWRHEGRSFVRTSPFD